MNQQYLEIVGSLQRNCFYLLALDACQYTTPGHVIQASLVVGGYITLILYLLPSSESGPLQCSDPLALSVHTQVM